MKKTIDCFTFFNELDLLEIRLKYLYDVIDYFVIVESDTSFNGKNKGLVFKKNKEKFKNYSDKIIYLPIKMKSFSDLEKAAWEREKYQRNCINDGLKKLNLYDDDLILISDIDEIPNKDVLQSIQNDSYENVELQQKNSFSIIVSSLSYFLKTVFYKLSHRNNYKYRLKLKFMYYLLIKRYTPPINFKMVLNFYYINYQKNDETWNGLQCVAAKWFNIFTVDEIRSFRRIPVKSINCGWHFSYLGGKEMIIYKIKNFSHQEFNIKEILSNEYIDYCIENGYSLFDYYLNPKKTKRQFSTINVNHFPKDLQKILNEYKNIIKT
ncbi:hypothetical protein N9672_01160 [Flavobacteriaceae bacterium]|nr:hypothetical protein [Flavobacteriaceae bacterium]MDB4182945.1 hypothetical protein [Flavobacteriaceae bacterium]MDC0092556.1 hypothetical protein [bacterium]